MPDFSWCNIPRRDKIYQMTVKNTKLPQITPNDLNIPNDRKEYMQDPPKFTQVGIFGSKIWQPLSRYRVTSLDHVTMGTGLPDAEHSSVISVPFLTTMLPSSGVGRTRGGTGRESTRWRWWRVATIFCPSPKCQTTNCRTTHCQTTNFSFLTSL
jgi:hypothetical protein